MAISIGILNYEIGNYLSVKNMIESIGFSADIIEDPNQIMKCNKLILPGVGSFDSAAAVIHNKYRGAIDQHVAEKKIILGICLGAQILGDGSEEGNLAGLGYIKMRCKSFQSQGLSANVGWKETSSRLIPNTPQKYYHIHNYYMSLEEKLFDLETTFNGTFEYVNGVKKENIIAVQYHPEKSNSFGKTFFSWFCNL
jgi:glutamine amidotransferase